MKRSLLLFALLLALLPLAGEGRSRSEKRWSRTSPAVNETHLFFGEINKRGKPVGFHARPGGRDPQGARVVRVVDRPNRRGVYTAEVEIKNGEGRWLRKRSTFFPDGMDREAVLAAVVNAYRSRTTGNADKFRGPSGKGFTIEGWRLDDGRINTAYPVYTND
ncbi:MAG TPA: EndoU domain-containing protein [Thermoanaerobaculia bacterium]|nr:EndoU domain-containing protein [Thermoanaerobaculia bacterium]